MRTISSWCGYLLKSVVVLVIAGQASWANGAHNQSIQRSEVVFPKAEGPMPVKPRFIIRQLWDDFTYLAGEQDFYSVVGGLTVAPSMFNSAFRRESPEFTELWGGSRFADNLFEIGETVGDGAFPVLASATSWSVGKIVGSSRLRDFGSDLFRTQVVNGFLTATLKGMVNRSRPDGAPHSYPSGHTSSAFATAGVIFAHFGKTWGIGAFALAGYVGFSRLQEGKHYLSDVIAGGILGSYVSLKLSGRKRHGRGLSIAPLTRSEGAGLALSLKF
ncbi:MAG: phosphatase PAP2 family protein [bacterium]